MVNPVISVEEVEALYSGELTPLQRLRAQLDVDAVVEILENWTRRKFTETVITDERHYISVDGQEIIPHYGPVKAFTGIKYEDVNGAQYQDYNVFWDRLRFARGQVVYISYVTDASGVQQYMANIKRIVINAVIGGLLKNDQVRFGVISGYSVEGLSINYGSPNDKRSNVGENIGDVNFIDLMPLQGLKRRVMA